VVGFVRIGVAGVWVCGGRSVEGRRTIATVPAAGEVGEVEIGNVEVAGVGFDGEVFVPFVLEGRVLVGRSYVEGGQM
jgi:hypothetical protein